MRNFKTSVFFFIGFLSWFDWIPILSFQVFRYIKVALLFLFFVLIYFNQNKDIKFSPLSKLLIFYFLYVFINTSFKSVPFLITYLNLLYAAYFLIFPSFSNVFIKGFKYGGLVTILFMLSQYIDFVTVNPEWINMFGFNNWFVNCKECIMSIGFTNKYNKVSYLLSFLVFLVYTSNKKFYFKVLCISIIVYFQIITGGRGGFLIVLLFLAICLGRKIKLWLMPLVFSLIGYYVFEYVDLSEMRVFEFQNASSMERFQQYFYAFNNMDKNIIFGHSGYTDLTDKIGSLHVHNMFINNMLMGGVLGLIFSIILITFLIKSILKINETESKVYLILLVIFQALFENFNPIGTIGSYVIFWLILSNSIHYDHKFFLKNINENNI